VASKSKKGKAARAPKPAPKTARAKPAANKPPAAAA